MELIVDFASPTGPFRGGAAGTLYGLGDEGVPTRAVLNGAHVTTTSQKPPFGQQHPSGDALAVETDFFAKYGRDMYVYLQDLYPDWPYHHGVRPGDDGNGRWSFLTVAERVADAVATRSAHPRDYVLIPFNEPDGGNWYPDWPAQGAQFLADWRATVAVLRRTWARHGLGVPRIGGPGDMAWQPERTRDFLASVAADGCLPDVFIWHELGIDNLGTFRSHLAEYRALERELGIAPIEVNITEYAMLRDMAAPGQLIQWFALFEDAKVDAQVAYWNFAGNLSDNSARAHGANGGWWLWKWYGDLAGSVTVRVVPPRTDVPDTLQGIGAVDAANRRATVLLGGAGHAVEVVLTGLDRSLFGEEVDVEVREARLTGVDGLHPAPPVVAAWSGAVVEGGRLVVAVPACDPTGAYQVLVTPAGSRRLSGVRWSASVEAEATALTAAGTRRYDPRAKDGWQFLASGGADVHSFDSPESSASWRVGVPGDGRYRFQLIGAAEGDPSQFALDVDGAHAALMDLPAGLALNDTSRGQYRASAEAVLWLPAGRHELTVRRSADRVTLLPGAAVTLDRFSLTQVGDDRYPASTFRLFDGARLRWAAEGGAAVLGSGRADLYVTAWETGYHDVTVEVATRGQVALALDGVPVGTVDAGPGLPGLLRVHLVQGVTEIELRGSAAVTGVAVRRAEGSDGMRAVVTLPEGADLVVPRTPPIAAAGPHHVVVTYANAETVGTHDYNPQVVDRILDVAEGARPVGRAGFRYTYSWANAWDRALPVELSTDDEPLRLTAPRGLPPLVTRIVVAPLRVAPDAAH